MYLQDDDLIKFSRTFHVPGSLGATNDDKVLKNLDHFEGKEVVVTEKLDGENTTGSRVKVHARSLDSKHHWTRDRVKQLFTNIQWKLSLPQFQDIHRICGENMQGRHSIYYSELESYFYCFAIWDRQNTCFSWDDMVLLCDELEVKPVPLLKRGIYTDGFLNGLYTGESKLGGVQEGYVMRLADAFHYDDYGTSVAKFVRENHVTTDQHWMKTCNVENKIRE
jgi:hypothetical protein